MNNENSQSSHVQLSGQAFYDRSINISEVGNVNTTIFMFCPDNPVPDQVPKYRISGMCQQMSDGTFDFVARPRIRANSTLIKKLAHGRASVTADGAIQLTLKVWPDENLEIADTIHREAAMAADAIRSYQLRKS